MNNPIESAFILLRHGMEYLIYQPNETIMYSRNNVIKLNEIPYQYFFKAGSVEIKNSRIPQPNRTYCNMGHVRSFSDRCSVTSTSHPFNVTIPD